MVFVEIIVNRPIRRSFRDSTSAAIPAFVDQHAGAEFLLNDLGIQEGETTAFDANKQEILDTYELFHYHLPPELEQNVLPGHLVWVPFGAQKVQGVVVRFNDSSPVPTRAVLRLARPEPVLSSVQMALAMWIANYYVAPLSESIKLFFPPGLLSKEDGSNRVRVKRELQIELQLPEDEALRRVTTMGRDNQQTRILSWLLEQVDINKQSWIPLSAVVSSCRLKTAASIHTLAKHGLLTIADAKTLSTAADNNTNDDNSNSELLVGLASSEKETHEKLLALRGVDKYIPIIKKLAGIKGPIWKSELYKEIDANLSILRALRKAGLITLTEEIRFRDPLAGRSYPRTTAPPFTQEQQQVWEQIAQLAFPSEFHSTEAADPLGESAQTHHKFLLHGVTGSGKTEIYLRSIAATLEVGKQAIVLVPEIALTPQTVARFAGRFPGRVTVIHSGLSSGERYDVWRHLRDGHFDVVIGPRSALFAPMARLGLIILDEEHESSYKQNAEEWGSFTVFYDARVVAERLAELVGAVLIYGSATPSMERYLAAQRKELILLELLRRVMGHRSATQLTVSPSIESTKRSSVEYMMGSAESESEQTIVSPSPYTELPPVEVVDMRQELRAGHRSMLSRALLAALHETLDAGEQAIFYLNRRGTRTFVMCRDCGAVQQCKRCDIPLTFHEKTEILICHHCNQRYPIPSECSDCNSKRIKYFGSGTQRLEETIQQIAPHARIMRWDADTVTKKGSHEEILKRFSNQEADILVGTQMIAKGLDFPLVTLVGVVAADVGLYLPDFRSGERAFQLLTQVAGRAGRGERLGRVIIQSYKPEHYAIQAAAQHDYHAFFERETAFRQEHGYPPFRPMARLIYWDKSLERAKEASATMAETLRYRLTQMGLEGEGTAVIGPAPAFFARYRSYYRWQVILRSPHPGQILGGLTIPFGWRIDIDPISML